MKHVVPGLLLGLCAVFPHLAGQGAAPIEAAARWLLAQPAVTAAALAYATIRGLRARPWPVRKPGAR